MSDEITTDDFIDSYLEHFGVKGMKWGIRRVDAGLAGAQTKLDASMKKDLETINAKAAAGTISRRDALGYVGKTAVKGGVRGAIEADGGPSHNNTVNRALIRGKKDLEPGEWDPRQYRAYRYLENVVRPHYGGIVLANAVRTRTNNAKTKAFLDKTLLMRGSVKIETARRANVIEAVPGTSVKTGARRLGGALVRETLGV